MDPQVDHRFLNEIEALKGNCAGEHVLRLVAALRQAWLDRDGWKKLWVEVKNHEADVVRRADRAEAERDAALEAFANRTADWNITLLREEKLQAVCDAVEELFLQRDAGTRDLSHESANLRRAIDAVKDSAR